MDELNFTLPTKQDFYYQRKQLMDAVIEQEKDTKLYEQICQSILNEKDLKKVKLTFISVCFINNVSNLQIIEKSRYDEDAEEWIIPYLKRKSIDSLDSSRGNQLYQYGNAAPPIASTPSASAGISILPDINLSSYYNKANLGLESNNSSTSSRVTSASSAAGAAAVAAASKASNTTKSNAISRVPILTLPGGLTTSASVMSSNNNSNNGMYSFRSDGVPPAGSYYGNGGIDDMPGIGFEKDSKDKRKLKSSHNKHKVPKPSNNNNNSGSSSSRVNDNAQQKALLSARTNSPLPVLQPQAQQHFQATGIDEEGTGITAGPVDDWGFAVNNEHSPSTNNTNRNASFAAKGNGNNNNNQQDVEYSDDEDFEAEDKIIQQTTPHPPLNGSKPPPGSASGGESGVNGRKVDTVGRKKKKKTSNNATSQQLVNIQGHHQEEFNGNVVTTLKQASPRVVSLPPIL
jgi:hypothetical protein